MSARFSILREAWLPSTVSEGEGNPVWDMAPCQKSVHRAVTAVGGADLDRVAFADSPGCALEKPGCRVARSQ